jgi:hypothetical protein
MPDCETCQDHKMIEHCIQDLSKNVDKLYSITEKQADLYAKEKEDRMTENAETNRKLFGFMCLFIGLCIIETGIVQFF